MIYSNFYKTVWYIPQDQQESPRPAAFLLQSPSYKLYSSIGNQKLPEGFIPEAIDELLLRACVKDSLNVENFSGPMDLPLDIQQDLLTQIFDLFYPTVDFMKNLEFNLDVSIDSRFNDSWSCNTCQAKRLDKQRNCPFLDPEEYHENTFSISVGEETYGVCPMNRKDSSLINGAFEAYRIADSGFLPEEGAYGDQPLLFCLLSQKVKEKLNYYERKELEAQRKSH